MAEMISSIVKAERFSSKIRNNTRMSTIFTFIENSIESPYHRNQTRKRNEMWKGRKKVTVCR